VDDPAAVILNDKSGREIMTGHQYAQNLFVKRLEDLKSRSSTTDYYDLLVAAGFLRGLLFDGEATLLHHANRDFKLKLRFNLPNVPQVEAAPGVELDVVILDFERSSCKEAIALNIDQFGSFRCLVWHGHVFSVRDVVETCANVRGGIHLGTVQAKDAAALEADSLQMWGQPSVMFLLSSIIKSAILGLEPLIEAIKRRSVDE
jgi:hypothetical protein